MTAQTKFKSDAFDAIHGAAAGMYRVGFIDKAMMRHVDEACLTKPPVIAPDAIKRLREHNKVSQPVFARHLKTSESTVEKWESGAKKPSGGRSSSCRSLKSTASRFSPDRTVSGKAMSPWTWPPNHLRDGAIRLRRMLVAGCLPR
ncbi:hypothetical protein Q4610_05720 [Sphingobium sp. HBC34]|uniref:HTH cro/C1-type domain-containing protein n=1 Tax=Sphingobium cyanobacteriorum TaxID=3063954 RepID=A0ABT8ZJ31_9SPHN|nr:hypothetical protein [Sphingobium sp. HBC34]MDO7834539.1 hypothetical protein [Sphingobium sp. HBC34]